MSNQEFGARTLRVIGWIAFLFVGWIFVAGWLQEGDKNGWMPHWRDVDLHFNGEWLSGESKTCTGIETFPDKNDNQHLVGLWCSLDSQTTTEPHHMRILFWGMVERPGINIKDEMDRTKMSWRCDRHSGDNFVCYAIN